MVEAHSLRVDCSTDKFKDHLVECHLVVLYCFDHPSICLPACLSTCDDLSIIHTVITYITFAVAVVAAGVVVLVVALPSPRKSRLRPLSFSHETRNAALRPESGTRTVTLVVS